MENIFIHSTAVVEDAASIGEGTKVWHWVHICSGAKIGCNVSIGQNVFVASLAKIGDGCKIQNNVSIFDRVILGEDVFCGPSCVFTNVINPRSKISRKGEYKETIVDKGATIGANATIICGNRVGEFAFIGAGAVVTKNVKPYSLMIGNPAKQSGWVSREGNRLDLPNFSKQKLRQVEGDYCYTLENDSLICEAI